MGQQDEYVGVVTLFFGDRGYGFVRMDGDERARKIFVHYSNIAGGDDAYRELKRGDRVRFRLESTERGLKAVDVRVLGEVQKHAGAVRASA